MVQAKTRWVRLGFWVRVRVRVRVRVCMGACMGVWVHG